MRTSVFVLLLAFFMAFLVSLSVGDTKGRGGYLFPVTEPIYVSGKIMCTDWYSHYRVEKGKRYQYKAVNIPCKYGTKLVSPGDGVVELTNIGGYEGAIVTIRLDDGNSVTVCHLSKFFVLDNMRVSRGQLIALSGTSGRVTGPHVRIRLERNGERIFLNAETWGMKPTDFWYSPKNFSAEDAKYYM